MSRVLHGGKGAQFFPDSCKLETRVCVWLFVIDFVFIVVVFEK
jgi:hypothetical protein